MNEYIEVVFGQRISHEVAARLLEFLQELPPEVLQEEFGLESVRLPRATLPDFHFFDEIFEGFYYNYYHGNLPYHMMPTYLAEPLWSRAAFESWGPKPADFEPDAAQRAAYENMMQNVFERFPSLRGFKWDEPQVWMFGSSS